LQISIVSLKCLFPFKEDKINPLGEVRIIMQKCGIPTES
jgi:hypothetical protein